MLSYARALTVPLAVCCFALTACGGPDAGCSDDFPKAGEVDPEMSTYVDVCQSDDFKRIQVKNVSNSSVDVFAASDGPIYTTTSLGTRGDALTQDSFVLAADDTQEIESDEVIGLDFGVDWAATIAANVQQAIESKLEGLVQTRSDRWAKRVQSCANAAADLATEHKTFADVVRSGLNADACTSLVSDALREDGTVATESEVAARRRQVVSAVRELAGETWKDELVKIAAQLHR